MWLLFNFTFFTLFPLPSFLLSNSEIGVLQYVFLNIHSALSRWCISHRTRAKETVEIWDKLFNASQKEQRVSFLYLANDILQNSKRKGSEFVNEFWTVLPAALRCVYESGGADGRKAVIRLVSLIFTCYKLCESSV